MSHIDDTRKEIWKIRLTGTKSRIVNAEFELKVRELELLAMMCDALENLVEAFRKGGTDGKNV